MFDNLLTIINFIVVLALLIAVHEFGHFWVARRTGVKVVRFSIGFGAPLFRWRRRNDPTEYVIAAIPLGGYVKMIDEREGEVDAADLPYAFNRQPLLVRSAIVAAGPIFNLVFALLLYWLMFINGVPGLRPLIGEVVPQTPAAIAGLAQGDEILSVNGSDTPSWQAVIEYMLPRAMLNESVKLDVRTSSGTVEQLLVDFSNSEFDLTDQEGSDSFMKLWGALPQQLILPPVIDQITPGSAAAVAGLMHADRILEIDAQPIGSWDDMVTIIKGNPGRPLLFLVQRGAMAIPLEIRPEVITQGSAEPFGRIGASVWVDPERFQDQQVMWQFSPLAAVGAAVEKGVDISVLTVKMMGQMIIGEAAMENLSGPITIARYAKASADAGLSQLLGFIAVISISLGVLNLLPIPILDGGHLFFYLIEAIKGSPVSEQVEAIGQRIGMVLILMMMSLAIVNDIMRLGS